MMKVCSSQTDASLFANKLLHTWYQLMAFISLKYFKLDFYNDYRRCLQSTVYHNGNYEVPIWKCYPALV